MKKQLKKQTLKKNYRDSVGEEENSPIVENSAPQLLSREDFEDIVQSRDIKKTQPLVQSQPAEVKEMDRLKDVALKTKKMNALVDATENKELLSLIKSLPNGEFILEVFVKAVMSTVENLMNESDKEIKKAVEDSLNKTIRLSRIIDNISSGSFLESVNMLSEAIRAKSPPAAGGQQPRPQNAAPVITAVKQTYAPLQVNPYGNAGGQEEKSADPHYFME